MEWIKYTEKTNLNNLPHGTILKTTDEYGRQDIKVVGTGFILNNVCLSENPKDYRYYEADWSSLGEDFDTLEYAVPPTEYIEFLKSACLEVLR